MLVSFVKTEVISMEILFCCNQNNRMIAYRTYLSIISCLETQNYQNIFYTSTLQREEESTTINPNSCYPKTSY